MPDQRPPRTQPNATERNRTNANAAGAESAFRPKFVRTGWDKMRTAAPRRQVQACNASVTGKVTVAALRRVERFAAYFGYGAVAQDFKSLTGQSRCWTPCQHRARMVHDSCTYRADRIISGLSAGAGERQEGRWKGFRWGLSLL